ncbi:hypothetical protein [Celeribacter marinus]|uniref:Type I secretion target repeat protein n=1 Tax=Celeribacter marinus TaxID=1397108 RepID=A0A0P0A7A5_9RHOB|nr:hypothetical protein [Celeribacter marinus]ALI54220.1 type I secretion target repeat protein [Celeribacter marinus]SFK32048.1 hypothetical protein SAMN05444421_10365 [Celeribacter marinus]
MVITLNPADLTGEAAQSSLFGGNVLASRGDLTGDGSYAEAIEALGVTDIRYPGGAITEYMFDIANPDADYVVDPSTGETIPFIPISDFMAYASDNDHTVTIVVPVNKNLGDEVDANGNRFAQIDEAELRTFINDVSSGVYGDAEISAFEIGNEYWGCGAMTSVEYGRVASQMSEIISDELDTVIVQGGGDTSEIDVVFQMGYNYGDARLSDAYDGWSAEDTIEDLALRYPDAGIDDGFIYASGNMNWGGINNALVQAEFNADEAAAADGIVSHLYSRGADMAHTRTGDLRMIEEQWLDKEGFEDLKVYITEWNQKSVASLDKLTDYGLYQAHEMLNIVEEFMAYDVEVAHVWPLIQNTKNPLATGFEYDEKSPAGEMFTMMSQTLPGKSMIDFAPVAQDTEFKAGDVDVHGFAGDDQLVFYIASNSQTESTSTDIDISQLVAAFGTIETTRLGVDDGDLPGSTLSSPNVERLDQSEIYEDGFLTADLQPGEILQVVITNVVPTDDFADTFNAANSAGAGMDAATLLDDLIDEASAGDVVTPEQEAPVDAPAPMVMTNGLFAANVVDQDEPLSATADDATPSVINEPSDPTPFESEYAVTDQGDFEQPQDAQPADLTSTPPAPNAFAMSLLSVDDIPTVDLPTPDDEPYLDPVEEDDDPVGRALEASGGSGIAMAFLPLLALLGIG